MNNVLGLADGSESTISSRSASSFSDSRFHRLVEVLLSANSRRLRPVAKSGRGGTGGGAGWKEGLAAVISSRDNGDGDSSDSNATDGIGGGATDGGRRFVSFCEGRLIRGEGKLFTSKRKSKEVPLVSAVPL